MRIAPQSLLLEFLAGLLFGFAVIVAQNHKHVGVSIAHFGADIAKSPRQVPADKVVQVRIFRGVRGESVGQYIPSDEHPIGFAVDDGVVMANYIQQMLKRRPPNTIDELRETVFEAGMKRVRPCLMTTITTLFALLPVLVSTGRGADVARAMAIPVFGGMLVEPFSSFVVPTIYCAIAEFKLKMGLAVDNTSNDAT